MRVLMRPFSGKKEDKLLSLELSGSYGFWLLIPPHPHLRMNGASS
jgi:hypothetical protein